MIVLTWLNGSVKGQIIDTLKKINIEAVTITSYRFPSQEVKFLPNINGNFIVAGKKTKLIILQNAAVNVSQKQGRKIFVNKSQAITK